MREDTDGTSPEVGYLQHLRKGQRSVEVRVGQYTVALRRAMLDRCSTLCQVRAGRLLIEAGTPARESFVVVHGVLSVHEADTGAYLRTPAPGELVGEVGVVANRRRSADVVANTDVLVLVMTPAELSTLCVDTPELGRAVRERALELA